VDQQEEFVEALRAEIGRRIEEGQLHIGRKDVERIGREARMSPDEAAERFMDTRGQEWEGDIVPNSDRRWTRVSFDREWFWQRHGIRPL
jgi:hypothetical protein